MMTKKVVKVSAKHNEDQIEHPKDKTQTTKNVLTNKNKKLPVAAQIALIVFAVFFALIMIASLFGSDDSTNNTTDDGASESISETTALSNYGKDFVIFEDAYITAKVQSVEKFPGFEDGVLVTFTIDNKSHTNLDIITQDIYVNDVKLEGYGFGANSGTIEPGKTGLLNLPFSYSRAYVESYDDLSTMQLSFHVMDHNDAVNRNYTTAPVTFDLHV